MSGPSTLPYGHLQSGTLDLSFFILTKLKDSYHEDQGAIQLHQKTNMVLCFPDETEFKNIARHSRISIRHLMERDNSAVCIALQIISVIEEMKG